MRLQLCLPKAILNINSAVTLRGYGDPVHVFGREGSPQRCSQGFNKHGGCCWYLDAVMLGWQKGAFLAVHPLNCMQQDKHSVLVTV